MKANPTASERLMVLFAGNENAHGTHGVPEKDEDSLKWNIKKTARTLRQPVTEALWKQHLAGAKPLGVIPIRENNTCSWGSIDFDVYDVDLLEIIKRVERAKLPLVPCKSKSGGLHLFLFLKEPAPAGEVQATLKSAAAALNMAECEIFPKQTRLDGEAIGNWMVMPYFGGTFDGKLKMQHGLKKSGAEMTLGEFVSFAEKQSTTVTEFAKLVGRPARASVSSKGDFSDGPPCLQRLTDGGFKGDGRKRTLFMMALYYKLKDNTTWKTKTESANHKFFSPPLPSEEVLGVIKSVDKREYEYTCKEEPMHGVCDSVLCRMRKFGVGGNRGDGDDEPVIVSGRKICSEEPIWFLEIEGSGKKGTLEIKRIDDLTNFRRFADQCGKQLSMYLLPVKLARWAAILHEAQSRIKDELASVDTTRAGIFHEHLESFLTNRARGDRREDVFSGRPWEDVDKKRHEFRMQDLHKFVTVEGMRDATRHDCQQWIKKLGGDLVSKTPTTIKGRGVRLWWVPSSVVQNMPELGPLPVPEGDI